LSIKKSGYEDEILKFIYTNYQDVEIPMTKLQDIITSYYTVTSSAGSLYESGLVNKREVVSGRKTIMISLTKKGREVAEQLKRAEAISQGRKLSSTERYAVILYLYRNGSKNLKEINEDLPGSTEILRELEKLNVVKQEIKSSKYPQETTLSLTEKGMEIGLRFEELERMMEE
jgi:DNA-binding MarR family transcriptional regulator